MTMLDHDWYPTPLPTSVVVGKRSWLYSAYSCVHLAGRQDVAVVIGTDTGVYDGTFFDLGPDGEVRIGNGCSIVGAIFATNSSVTVGDHVLIAHEVVFADTPFARPAEPGETVSMEITRNKPRRRNIVVGDGAWIGANVVVLGGISIGEDAIVAAGSVVDGDVPSGAVWAGNPGRVVRAGPLS